EAQKVMTCRPHLGSTLLKSEKRLALCARLTYYKPIKCLTGATLLSCAVCSHCAGVRRGNLPTGKRLFLLPIKIWQRTTPIKVWVNAILTGSLRACSPQDKCKLP